MFKVAIVVASLVQPVTLSKQALTICGSAAQSAETTMKLRQMGISLVKVMEAINRTVPDPNKPGEVAAVENQQRQALAAYDHPRYETDDMQQKAIADFRDEEYRDRSGPDIESTAHAGVPRPDDPFNRCAVADAKSSRGRTPRKPFNLDCRNNPFAQIHR